MRNMITFCLIAVACGCSKKEAEPAPTPAPEAATPAPPPAPAAPAFDAQQVFNTLCVTCHGKEGLGDGPATLTEGLMKPASFADPAFWETRDRDQVIKVIKEGGAAVHGSPLMVAYGAQYNDEQIGQLADIVMTFKP